MSERSDQKKMGRFSREALKIAAVVVTLVGLMVWLAGGFARKVDTGRPESTSPMEERPKTARVERRSFPLLMEQVGTVRAQSEAQVSSRIMAQVKEIRVREGDLVTGGEGGGGPAAILAVLDDAEIQARVAQAEAQRAAVEKGVEIARARLVSTRAQVESARANRERVVSDHRRTEGLHRDRAATGQQLEHARAQKDMVEAQLRALLKEAQAAESDIGRSLAQLRQMDAAVSEARSMLDHTVIRAPFSGKVLGKTVDVGDMAAPGQPLFYLDSPLRPELHVHLSESVLPSVLVGQELDVRIDALGRSFSGKLREIQPRSDPATRTLLARVSLPPDRELVNGMFGRVQIPQGEYDSVVVPKGALQEVGQLTLVTVWHPHRGKERRFVTPGPGHGELVEILSGLDEGEEVVVP
ncbi:MAG: efflux RND transporter periplasmic adaptor subunit [Syntrophobacteraceae bacterium]|nr:efflux RND transporter periplasmic adaptor subunit [Syntrophobacteraceae bacterium]